MITPLKYKIIKLWSSEHIYRILFYDDRANKTDNRNKLYQSLLMGFWMGFIELITIKILSVWTSFFTFLLFAMIAGIFLLTYLIYFQIGINETSSCSRFKSIIDMVLLLQPQFKDPRLLKIMDNILESQRREIEEVQEILDERCVPKDILLKYFCI